MSLNQILLALALVVVVAATLFIMACKGKSKTAAPEPAAQQEPAKPAEPEPEPGPEDLGITVVSDPGQIEKWKREMQEEMGDYRVKAVINELDFYPLLGRESRAELSAAGPELLPGLRKKLADPEAEEKVKINAAMVLSIMDEPDGYDFLEAIIKNPESPSRKSALSSLRQGGDPALAAERPELAQAIINLLSSPDPGLAKEAVEASSYFNITGAAPRLAEMLKKPETEDKGEICHALSRLSPGPETAGLVAGYYRDSAKFGDYRTLGALASFLRSGDPAAKPPILEALAERIEKEGREQSPDMDRKPRLLLARYATKEFAPLLREMAENQSLQADVRSEAILSLSQLGSENRELIEKQKEDPKLAGACALALCSLDPASAASHCGEWEKALGKVHDHNSRLLLLRAFALACGKKSPEALVGALKKSSQEVRGAFLWDSLGISLKGYADFLADKGFLGAEDPQACIDEVMESEGVGSNDYDRAWTMLIRSRKVFWFDTESGQVPCEHDHLLEKLAAKSGGAFAPDWAHEIFEEGEYDGDGAYTLRFAFAGKAFETHPQDIGDYYDYVSVVNAVNVALKEAGRPERLFEVEGGAQDTGVLIAVPELKDELAARFFLVFREKPGQAVAQGIAFEEEVRKSLNQ